MPYFGQTTFNCYFAEKWIALGELVLICINFTSISLNFGLVEKLYIFIFRHFDANHSIFVV